MQVNGISGSSCNEIYERLDNEIYESGTLRKRKMHGCRTCGRGILLGGFDPLGRTKF
jgi:hypothetical protein